eukprot:TRINITY_DN5483_c0_g1_i2.p1 TRINITY_DN5483_c0_g1~~TRINITY_DN5483_c0_g1_i2.p1  ORF type:complete len:308 (+),score=34.59 TRINITY_DN5483_c0_g1_i2:30-953(+)
MAATASVLSSSLRAPVSAPRILTSRSSQPPQKVVLHSAAKTFSPGRIVAAKSQAKESQPVTQREETLSASHAPEESQLQQQKQTAATRHILAVRTPSLLDQWFARDRSSVAQMISAVDRVFEDALMAPFGRLPSTLRSHALLPGFPRGYARPVLIRSPWEVKETDEATLIRIEMPGLSKDEVSVKLQDGTLLITGAHNADLAKVEESAEDGNASNEEGTKDASTEASEDSVENVEGDKDGGKGEEDDAGGLWNPRVTKTYAATVALPDDSVEDGITAEMKNGVLTIVVPKRKEVEEPVPDAVEIHVS